MVGGPETRGTLVTFVICAMLAAGPSAICARTEEVLAWDDGDPDAYYGYPDPSVVAVWFQAPEWAASVVAVHVWFVGQWSPPFTVRLHRPAGEWPYEPGPSASDPYDPGVTPGGDWAVLALPEQVDVTDPAEFPDRVFFVGVEWSSSDAAVIGVDTDDPVNGKSVVWNWSVWEPYELGDIMIRAVVSDSAGTAVEAQSWGLLKSKYRGSRLPN